tara:strand:+ start:128 stop:1249 length:1122 start_codon:yes stop_codon:yes gene_type:complete
MSKTTIPTGGITDGTLTSTKLDQDGAFTFNEDSADVDFRVESNGNTHMFFIDGGNNRVGMVTTADLGTGLHIRTADSGGAVEANADELVVEGSGNSGLSILSGTSSVGAIHMNDSGGNERGAFKYDHNADQMQFKVAGNLVATWAGSEVVFNENSLDQGFRIESNGKANLFFVNGGGDQIYINNNDNISAQGILQIVGLAAHNVVNIQVGTNAERGIQWFNQSGVAAGDIVVNASSVAYNTSSDYRLKENVDYTWDATTRLKQLKPARFNWIEDDTNTLLDGFLAHEVSSIVPEAVSGVKDATVNEVLYTRNILYDEDDVLPKGKNLGDIKHAIGDVKQPAGINPQRIDQSKLVPLLVKTIQELEARVTTLEE